MMKNTQSSMEFHIKKEESYFIYEGELDIGLRYARAKQKITKLKKIMYLKCYQEQCT